MRAIAEEECDAAAARGETGYPAMWAADRIEVIEDCLRWLGVERDDPTIRQLPLGACEARFGPRYPGEEVGTLSRDEPIEIDLGGRALRLAGRIDRITWDAQPPTRFRVDRLQDRQGPRREAGAAAGRADAAAAAVRVRRRGAARARPDGGRGRLRLPDPPRELQGRPVDQRAAGRSSRRRDRPARAVLDGIGRGDFMIAPWKDDGRTACRYCDFNEICPGAHAGYAKRKAEDPRRDHLDDVIRSVE